MRLLLFWRRFTNLRRELRSLYLRKRRLHPGADISDPADSCTRSSDDTDPSTRSTVGADPDKCSPDTAYPGARRSSRGFYVHHDGMLQRLAASACSQCRFTLDEAHDN